MQGFGFTKTQEVFRRQVRKFVQGELKPTSRERAEKRNVPDSLLQEMAKIGLLGIEVPKEWGGQDSGWISFGIACEELGRSSVTDGFLPAVAHQALAPLRANVKMAEEWLPQIVTGSKGISFSIMGRDLALNASSICPTAVKEGEYYALNGRVAPCWSVKRSDAIIVLAGTNPEGGSHGVTAFQVSTALPGVSMSELPSACLKPYNAAEFSFDHVRVPLQFRLGEEGQGLDLIAEVADINGVAIGLACLGAALASVEESVEYARERTVFGQPLARFQAISFKIAENQSLLEAARMLCYKTLWMKDNKLPHSKESAMCKWHCCELAASVIHDSLLVFGNVGYSEEMPFAQRLKDVLGFTATAGGSEVSKSAITQELMDAQFTQQMSAKP